MTSHTDAVVNRMFGRTEKLLEAIDNGEPIEDHLQRIEDSAPWELAALAQASVLDYLEMEAKADDGLTQNIKAVIHEKDEETA